MRRRYATVFLMPELPEVETVVRGLRLVLPGRSIVAVRLGKTDFIDDPAALGEVLPGKRIVAHRAHRQVHSFGTGAGGGVCGRTLGGIPG